MPTIMILNGEREGQTFVVDKPVIALGRRADNDICLAHDPRVSRFHAQLMWRGQDWILEDLGSRNGTFVGQRRIHGPTVIRPGDRFRLGRTWLTIVPEPVRTSEAEARERVFITEEAAPLWTPKTGAGPMTEAAEGATQAVVVARSLDQPRPTLDGQQARRWLDVLSRVSQSLASTLDLAQLMDVIIESVMAVIPADAGFVILVDRQTGEFVPKAMQVRPGVEAAEGRFGISRHILDYAIAERVAVLTADAMHDERFEDLDSVHEIQLRAALCAPLFHGEEALGAIFLESRTPGIVFSEQDVELLRMIAGQAATAIENARLYTDMRHTLEELQRAQEQILRSERLSTIGMITASIAHDMANIVVPLKPLLQLALRDHTINPELRESLDRQMDRLTALLERLLSFSKGETHLQPVSVNELLEKTLSLIRSEITHRKVKLVTEFGENLPPVMGDPAQLDRVFLNLCMNALEALDTLGREEERVLTIRTEQDGEEIAISITDTGPGIPLAIQEHLFEPLFTTKATGTGLGLYSCKRIVEEEHHGTIEVDSLEGMGATFTVRLPALSAASAPPQHKTTGS